MTDKDQTTSAGKWSVVFALTPLILAILVLLPFLLTNHSGEAGWGLLWAFTIVIYYGSQVGAVTGILGVALGAFAVYKTSGRQGCLGLVFNIAILTVSCIMLIVAFHDE